jgi:hypothetical protein
MHSFKKAERKQAKLKIGISGPSGSGKTFSAMLIAKGLGGRIAVIDTENRSASLYADRFEFDTLELEAPFTTEKYLQAMALAQNEKYDVVIIDSVSHQWAGEGGVLSRKEQVDSRGGNSFTNWSKFTPEHTKFLNAIVQHGTHLITTVRSKQDYALTQNDKGKATPQKMGVAPVQREGFEYELTLMIDMHMDHSAVASKDRTGLFDKTIFVPGEDTGKKLMAWLSTAKVEAAPVPPDNELKKALFESIKIYRSELGMNPVQLVEFAKQCNINMLEATVEQLKELCSRLMDKIEQNRPPENMNKSI